MRFLIAGAGAIGGYMGACLARAGQDVTLFARGPHLRAIEERGLAVISAEGDFHVRPKVTGDLTQAGQVAGDGRVHVEIAFGADDGQATLLDGAQVRTAGQESDVRAGARQASPHVAADGPRSGDQKPHGYALVSALATSPR